MWYVIQTFSGDEEKTANMIKKLLSVYSLEDCFVPKRERMKKFHGCWNRVEEVLFQGYVFVVSKKPEGLYEELKQVPRLTKVLGREENYFFPLNETDQRLIQGIGGEKHKATLSQVEVREGREIYVIDGPLKDYIGDVVKINLHKREAIVRVKFMGKKRELCMGIEMVNVRKNEFQ